MSKFRLTKAATVKRIRTMPSFSRGGPVKLWEDFTHEFDTILNEPPVLTPHEFKKRARWRQRADERILRTVRKVEESTLNALIFTIGNDEFAKLARAMEAELGTPPPRFARNPYFFAFMATLVLLMGGARSQPDLKIQLIYDENLSERSALEHGYRLFREWATANYPALLDMLAAGSSRFDSVAIEAGRGALIRRRIERSSASACLRSILTTSCSVPTMVNLPLALS